MTNNNDDFSGIRLPSVTKSNYLYNVGAFLTRMLRRDLLPTSKVLLSRARSNLLPLLLTLIVPSTNTSRIVFSLHYIYIVIYHTISNR